MSRSYYQEILRRMLVKYVDTHGEPILCYTHNSNNLEEDFNNEVVAMPNGTIRVFTEIPLGQIPNTANISSMNISLALQRLFSARRVCGITSSNIPHMASAVGLKYDFLFVIKDKLGNTSYFAVEINGDHHYIGTGPKFFNQLKNDATKMMASEAMGIHLREINVMHGFEPSDYKYIESLLKKGKAKIQA